MPNMIATLPLFFVFAFVAVTACVTQQPAELVTAPSGPEAPPTALTDLAAVEAAAKADALDDMSTAQSKENIAAGLADASLWREALTKDLVAIESKGDLFLEAASKLYDRLMAAGDKGVEVDQSTRVGIESEVKTSRDRYVELMTAVSVLHQDLDRSDVKIHLPAGLSGMPDPSDVSDLFNDFVAPAAAGGAYDLEGKVAVTSLIFRGGKDDVHGTDGLPKMQQDALSLLDRLRVVRSDLAYVSGTVSVWVHEEVDVPDHLPNRLSGVGPSFPQDVDPSALTHH